MSADPDHPLPQPQPTAQELSVGTRLNESPGHETSDAPSRDRHAEGPASDTTPSANISNEQGGTLIRAALVQFLSDPSPGGTLANLVRMSHFVESAAQAGAQLVVFPELATCGYGCSAEALEDAVKQERLVLETFARLASTHNIRIVASYPSREPSTDNTYITASVFAPGTGALELTYHKTHPWAASIFERTHFKLGNGFAKSIGLHLPAPPPHREDAKSQAVAPEDSDGRADVDADAVDDVWLNALICWDIEFPEPARAVRLVTPGTHHAAPLVLCVPTANADGSVAAFTVRARAAENHAFVLYVNGAGSQFCGGSLAVGPDGQVLAQVEGTEEGMVFVEMDVGEERYARTRRMNPMLEWRRPELYAPITDAELWPKPSDPKPPIV